MKNEYLLFTVIPLILAFSLSGCDNLKLPLTTETQVKTALSTYSTAFGGLSLDFSLSDKTVYNDTSFTLDGILTNRGDQEAKNIKVTLLKYKGILECANFSKPTSIPSLFPGEQSDTISWDITPKDTGEAGVKASVSYHYSTSLITQVEIFSYKYTIEKGGGKEYKESSGIISFNGSTSPVVISMKPISKDKLRVRDSYPVKIEFDITNPGYGIVNNTYITMESENKVICKTRQGEKITSNFKLSDEEVRKINMGSKFPIYCTINYNEGELNQGPGFKTVTIKFNLDYDYDNVIFGPFSFTVTS